MSDLISRRKAFEYFVTLWECIGTIMDRDEWEDVCMTTANEIPSAQPEIIRCKDCRYWEIFPSSSAMPWLHECHARIARIHTAADEYCSRAERREVSE